MDISMIMNYFSEYGLIFLFIIVFLEYLNLPGFPAGIIMPAAGIMIAQSGLNFVVAILISVLAGVLGSWLLYFLGRWGGPILIEKYTKRFPSQKKYINKSVSLLNNHGNKVIFITKLLPAIRTIIGVPAGALKMNFINYTVYSAMGIFIWNTVLILGGYFVSDKFL